MHGGIVTWRMVAVHALAAAEWAWPAAAPPIDNDRPAPTTSPMHRSTRNPLSPPPPTLLPPRSTIETRREKTNR